MSWGEVKKVNSDLNVPLNHLIWLNDYKTYGTKSYVYNDKDILHALYRSSIAANDEDVQADAFSYIAANEESNIGLWLSKHYDFRGLTNLKSCKSISDIVKDTDIVNAIKESKFKNAFFNLDKVAASYATTDGLKAASQDNDIMTLLEASSTFKAAISSSHDIQNNNYQGAHTVENAFIISATADFAGGNNGHWYRPNMSYILHGSTGETSLNTSATWDDYDRASASNISMNKFVKSFKIANATLGIPTNNITFIQLDNVV